MRNSLPRQPIAEVFLRGLTWAFVGTLFGFVYVVIGQLLRGELPEPLPSMLACVLGASLSAMFYGSIRLAVLIANAIFIATLLFILFGGQEECINVPRLVLASTGIGIVVGAIYAFRDKCSRICLADGKMLAGVFAGLACSLLVGLFWLLPAPQAYEYPWLPMLLAPVVGIVYMNSAEWFVQRLHNLLPPIGDGAVVGLGVGLVTGLLFATLGGSLQAECAVNGRPMTFLTLSREVLGPSTIACALICFVLGGLREILRIRRYRL